MIRLFLLSLLALCLATPSFAASRQEPAYRSLQLSSQWRWQDGLRLDLAPDEAACRKAYGNRWTQKCAAPLGRPGFAAKGIQITPKAQGSWQWEGPYTARFLPASGASLVPGKAYQVDLATLPLPANISLKSRSATIALPPLCAKISESRFWPDPSPAGRHRLYFAIDFNSPVPADKFRPALNLPAGLRLGEMEAVWSGDRDHVALSWPILKLPAQGATAQLTLDGLKKAVPSESGLRILPEGSASFSQPVPGAAEIFTIRDAQIAQEKGADGSTRYVLELTPSLYTDPKAVAENILLVEMPEFRSAESLKPYDWANAPAISAKDLENGRLLRIEATQSGPQSRLRYQLPVKSGRHVFVWLDKRVKSAGGLPLSRPFTRIAQAQPVEAQIRFLQPGNILSGNGDVSLSGVELDEIEWQIQLVDDPFLGLVASSSSNSFADPLSETNLRMDSLSRSVSGRIALRATGQGEAAYASLNPARIMADAFGQSSGLARIVVSGWKDGERKAEASRLVLATDVALIAKRATDGSLECFAHSITGAKPLAGIEISVIGANGRPVVSGAADASGHIRFASLAGLASESRPVAVIARGDAGLAWLPLNERSREVDYSAFDTAGRTTSDDILAYVFSQRGIYRPGDTLRFGCLTRRGDFSPLPADLALYGELLNPAGRKIREMTLAPGREGISEAAWDSLPESVSGKYTFNVKTAREGEVIGSVAVRMEAFQPDTLRLRVAAPVSAGWLVLDGRNTQPITAQLRNLYGAPAKGHNIRTELRTGPARFSFDRFRDYSFADPAPFMGQGITRKLPERKSGENGAISLTLPADLGGASARISIACEGLDLAGGRATTGSASFLASPATRILGYKPAGSLTNLDFIEKGTDAKIELLAIDSVLAPVAWDNLQVTLLARNYLSSLVGDGNGGYRYDELPQEMPVASWSLSLPAKSTQLSLPTENAGEFLLKVRDANGAVVLQLPYNVAGERVAPPAETLAGSKMRMRLSQKSFRAGDEIGIACALPYDAFGLIAIERDKVETFQWVEAHAGDNLFGMRVPEDFEGRGYVTATFMRKDSSPLIYMNPLAWSAQPFMANIDKRNAALVIEAAEETTPGSLLKVRLSSDKPGKALLFAVDEGILQLTAWRNPEPVEALLADRALAVATLQIADLLMPSSRLSGRGAAFGGGMDGNVAFGSRFQNPFRRRDEPPLTFWSGLVDIGPAGKSFEIPVPSWYAGSIRLIAVASDSERAGSAAKQVKVAGPIVLTPVLPAFIAPGDEFGGSLVIANTTQQPAHVNLALKASQQLKLLSGFPENLNLAPGEEKALPFRFKSGERPGVATLAFEAGTRDYALSRSASLSIRPASALRTSFQSGLATGLTELPVSRQVYPHDANSEVFASGIPLPLGFSFAKYLDAYPYGCTEQLLSRAFALIVFHKWPQAGTDSAKAARLLNSTIDAIASRFNGQFVALWPQGEGNLLLTAYAADFLLALRESGLGNADALLENLCDALRWNCSLNEPTLAAARASAYALWVLAREGRIVTQQLEELESALTSQDVPDWERDITAALLAAAKKEMAIEGAPDFRSMELNSEGWFDEYGQRSLLTLLAARYFPEALAAPDKQDFLDASAAALNENAFSTWSAAQGSRALMALAGNAAPDLAGARLRCLDPGANLDMSLDAQGRVLSARTGQCSRYQLAPADAPLFWQIATTGYDIQLDAKAIANGIEIEREYLDLDGRPVKNVAVGDELQVRITARSEAPVLEDCVIADLLPGCMERIIPASETTQEEIKYRDFREDRVLLFARLQNQPLEIVYKCRVIAPGVFQIPAITAESMYDTRVNGNGKNGTLRVLAK